MMSRLQAVFIVSAAIVLCGCPSNNQVTLPPPGTVPLSRLYVANGYAVSAANRGKIFVYTQPVTSLSIPSFTLVTGNATSALESFAFDAANVYVADCNDHLVRAFTRPMTGASTQAFTIATTGPDGIAIDSVGNLYTGEDCTATDVIHVFNPPLSGTSTASVTVTDASNINSVQQMVLDNAGHLYVANFGSGKQILQYNLPLANSSTAAVAVSIAGETHAEGIAIDPQTNQLWVASVGQNKLYAFALPITGSSTPALTVTTSNASRKWQNLAFDVNGNMYASDLGTVAIDVFVPPFSASSNPAFSLTPSGIDSPWGLSIGPQ